MTSASRLRDRLPELVRQLDHFARVPRDLVPDLVDHLQRTLEASKGRAKGAATVRGDRSTAIRAGVRRAAGVLPLQRGVAGVIQRRIERAGPATYRLARVPGIETIRDVVRAMNEEKKASVSESKASQRAVHTGYASVSQSST
mgnify:CR=1 FL=1